MNTGQMDHSNFAGAIAQLWGVLGLEVPPADDMQSVSVGGVSVHVVERPERHVLMFSCIRSDSGLNAELIHKQNAFSDDALKPVVGLDETTQQWLVWNRQPISVCDADTLSHQMEQVVECAEQLSALP